MYRLFAIALSFLSISYATTYYIDFESGSDTQTGQTQQEAFKRHPFMNGFTGAYTHHAGDRFIFKGGVLWPSSCFSATVSLGGTESLPDYWGAEKAWFSGASWKKPVFDGQNSALAHSQTIISINSVSYITFDNFEIKGLLINSNVNFGFASIYIYHAAHITLRNCYIHDWTIDAGVTHDDMFGGIIGNNTPGTTNGNVVDSCIISDSLNGGASGLGVRSIDTLKNCVIHDVPNAALGAFSCIFNNVIHDVHGSFDPAQHENALYVFGWNNGSGPASIYNNIIYNADVMSLYVAPGWNQGGTIGTVFIYNNVICKCARGIEVDPENATAQTAMYVYLYNNTVEGGFRITPRSSVPPVTKLVLENNHFISEANGNPALYNDKNSGAVASVTDTNNLTMTHAVATPQGFSGSTFFAPTQASAGTVDKGIDLSPLFHTDILGTSRPRGRAWDIGAFEFMGSEGTVSPFPREPTGPIRQRGAIIHLLKNLDSRFGETNGKPLYSLRGEKRSIKSSNATTVVVIRRKEKSRGDEGKIIR
jgi:hypothetical protein